MPHDTESHTLEKRSTAPEQPKNAHGHMFQTFIPARLDAMPWTRFHSMLAVALGITWILDGLEVTLMGAISAVLERPDVLHLTGANIGLIGSSYLAGAVLGSLGFGRLTDRSGRRRIFFVTLSVYLAGVAASALAWNIASLAIARFFTGCGIGGEYAAVNSAIDEMVPARVRGRINLTINGSFWLGAAVGSLSTLVLLNPRIFPYDLGWRLGFGCGALIGLVILYLRRFVPESPRWLLTHGRADEAEAVMMEIERSSGRQIRRSSNYLAVTINPGAEPGFRGALRTIVVRYHWRAILVMSLMVAQAFTYNAVFFTYAIVLTRFYQVPAARAGIYLLPFAIGNFLGPLVLGRYFDTIGRRPMIVSTYTIAAAILAASGVLFDRAMLSAAGQTAMWSAMFFFASAAASAAYLTAGEVFPLEIRALSIAIFYAAGTAAGGIAAPWVFGRLADSTSRGPLMMGYFAAALLMLLAAAAELRIGVAAERTSLEQIAPPLSSER
jgi:MFS family permease